MRSREKEKKNPDEQCYNLEGENKIRQKKRGGWDEGEERKRKVPIHLSSVKFSSAFLYRFLPPTP